MTLEITLTNPYPDSVRKLALKNVLQFGRNVSEVAVEMAIPRSTLYSWLRKEQNNIKNSKDKFISAKLENELQVAVREREVLATAIKILLREPKIKSV
ncbi:transposase [Alteromonas macleodii]|uniref:transposase n=1 Tax=Alteromonas macleodii TaxID=28108 RepID=UPI001278891B|nr:transposase [Alteromonas macleodii]CAI2390231.1 Transposase [Alteromonas macleodii]CAI3958114.1 Transposase [Alteromonas macleodii]CAI3959131.1 Transposase [Alteromonas macleodii]CAI3959140.1 Transposase [Alteromonas macleodii]VTO39827.1 Transposase [Alteromonas macleodii]